MVARQPQPDGCLLLAVALTALVTSSETSNSMVSAVRTLLELYGVTGAERDGLIQLTREARQPGWWHSYRDVLPNPHEVYISLEAGSRLHPQLRAQRRTRPAANRGITPARRSGTGR